MTRERTLSDITEKNCGGAMGAAERRSLQAEISLTNAIDTWPQFKRTYFIALNYTHACDVGGRYVQMSTMPTED